MDIHPSLTADPVAPPARGPRADAWRWTLVAAGLLMAVYPFVPYGVELGIYHLVGLGAVVGILAGVRLHRLPRPLPWILLAAGQLAFAVGDGMWDLDYHLLGPAASPSPADILYVSAYPLLASGLALLAHLPAGRGVTRPGSSTRPSSRSAPPW